ncbi:MAG: tetratricopeptide repeat protein, partial [Myxococcaceae bacterium]
LKTWSTHSSIERRFALAALVLMAAAAQAKGKRPDAQEASARHQFAEATKAYDLGQFEQALKGYSEAYQVKALPGFLFNIGQCHRQLGDHERALFFLKRYLSVSVRPPKNAGQVRALIEDEEKKLAEKARQEQERFAREAAEREAAKLTVAAQDRPEREVPTSVEPPSPLPLPLPAPDRQVLIQPEPPREDSIMKRWWFWTGLGVVVAGAATATYVATAPPPKGTTLGEVNTR